jgi:hypothetical protein
MTAGGPVVPFWIDLAKNPLGSLMKSAEGLIRLNFLGASCDFRFDSRSRGTGNILTIRSFLCWIRKSTLRLVIPGEKSHSGQKTLDGKVRRSSG